MRTCFLGLHKILSVLYLMTSRDSPLSLCFTALETTQAELFDLKTKYDEESTAKYVVLLIYVCVFFATFPLWLSSLLPDITILFSASPCLETPPFSPQQLDCLPQRSAASKSQHYPRTVNTDSDAFCCHGKRMFFVCLCRLEHSVIHQGHDKGHFEISDLKQHRFLTRPVSYGSFTYLSCWHLSLLISQWW